MPTIPEFKKVGRPHILYDREEVGGPHCKAGFFVDCQRTATGKVKNREYTNNHQSGQLGYPLSMDVVSLEIHPTEDDGDYAERYRHFIHSTFIVRFILGAHTEELASLVLLATPKFRPILLTDERTREQYRMNVVESSLAPSVSRLPELWEKAERLAPRSWSLCRVVDGQLRPRHIDSTESFRVEMERQTPLGGEPLEIIVGLEGRLYQPGH